METKINNKQNVYKHFERIKNCVKTWQANGKENKIIVTMVIFGHEVNLKNINYFKKKVATHFFNICVAFFKILRILFY